MHGLPNCSPSGLNNVELLSPFVKQENSPEENHLQHQPHLPPHYPQHQGQPQPHPHNQLHQHQHLHPQPPLQYPAVGSSQHFDYAQSLDLCDGGISGYQDSMGGMGDLGSLVGGLASMGKKSELGFLLMDEALSPMGGDPLLSAMSPDASVDSSRRSSFSIEDSDIL